MQLRSDFQSAATVSTIAFVAGSVALVGGGLLFFTAPKARDRDALRHRA